jgi:hypothetical protein
MLMYQSLYYVDKTSNSPGDSLAAYGTARLFRFILEMCNLFGSKQVKVTDQGSKYAIELPTILTEQMVDDLKFFSTVEFILTAKNAARQPITSRVLNYDGTKARVNEYFERRKTLPTEAKGKNADPLHPALQELKLLTPRPDWPTFQAINQMSAIIGYNDMVLRWEENAGQFPAMIKLILQMFSSSPNPVEAVQAQWSAGVKQGRFKGKPDATASQLFNPVCGKGQNSSKSSALAMGNLTNFWLLEFLKCIGAFEAAAPRIISNPKNPRAKDRKLYVLAPRDIELEINKTVWDEFCQTFRSDTSVKMDIKASLTYTRVFLSRSEVMAGSNLEFDFEGRGPENYVNGLWSVFYKDLGNSSAVMNLSFIGLPNWMKDVKTSEQVGQYLALIDEHEGLLKQLKEERSEEYAMLLTYRNFLSGQDLTALLDFYADYGRFYMGVTEREWDSRGRFLRLPTIENLEVIMASQDFDLESIIKDEGFLQVAYALRHSTVIPQRNKARGNDRLYEPKYGLIQELKRKGQYKAEFITALTDFISNYNLETEQIFERKKGFTNPQDALSRKFQRSRVEKKHLDSVIRLVEATSPSLICNLLAAYGSAVDTRSKQEQDAVGAVTGDLNPSEDENDTDTNVA